jgi:excisionase family DNA binding protein
VVDVTTQERDAIHSLGRRLLSVREAAAVLGISRSKLYMLMDAGELAFVKVGTRRLVDLVDVEHFIAVRREVAAKQSLEMREPGSFPGSKGSRDERDDGQGTESG